MRTYGRIPNNAWTFDSAITFDSSDTIDGTVPGKAGMWVEVETDENGNNDLVYVTALIQVLKLNLNESPFYASFGIPAQPSVVQQVFPDYYVSLTQQYFSQFFASLLISKQADSATPTYQVYVTTHQGTKINLSVPIPT